MDRQLLNYLPPVLRNILEFQAINSANEPEIAIAWDSIALLLANQFLQTADENGVSIWERELDIHPKDTDDLTARKTRIKAMWNLALPYTVQWLKNWLVTVCGSTGHKVTISEYTIDIELDYSILPNADILAAEILKMLLAIRPANMAVIMRSLIQSYGKLTYVATSEMFGQINVWPRSIHEIITSSEAVASGAMTYSAKLEVYPQGGK